MKKLQKAVHRKEQNVQAEKQEFEVQRKELEQKLKDIKNQEKTWDNREYQNPRKGARAGSIGERKVERDNNPYIEDQIQKYESRQAHTLSSRNSYDYPSQDLDNPILLHRRQTTGHPAQPGLNHMSADTISNPSLSQVHIYSDERGISPHSNNNRQGFGSIERHQDKQRVSVEGFERAQINSQSPSMRGSKTVQVQRVQASTSAYDNLKRECDLLHQQVCELIKDRDHLSQIINQHENSHTQLKEEKSLIEKQLIKERKRLETRKREINEVQLEKETLIHELSKLQQQLPQSTLSHNDKQQIQSLSQRLVQFQEQQDILETLNQEYKRTIVFLEENNDLSKQTITDLKAKLSQKDLELSELREHFQTMSAPIRTQHLIHQAKTPRSDQQIPSLNNEDLMSDQENDDDLVNQHESNHNIKEQANVNSRNENTVDIERVISNVEGIVKEKESEMEEMMRLIEGKVLDQESKVNKLKRMIQRKVKETQINNEINLQNQKHFLQVQNELKELQMKYDQLLQELKEKTVSLKDQTQKNSILQDDLTNLQQSHQKEITSLSNQLEQINFNHQNELQKLQEDLTSKDLSYQTQIQNLKLNHQSEILRLNDNHKTMLAQISPKKEANSKQQIDQVQSLMISHSQELESLRQSLTIDFKIQLKELKTLNQQTIQEKDKLINQQDTQINDITGQLSNLKQQNSLSSKQQQQDLNQANDKIKTLATQQQQDQKSINALSQQIEQKDQIIISKDQELDNLIKQNRKKEIDIQQLKNELEEVKILISEKQEQIDQQETQINNHLSENKSLKLQLVDYRQEVKNLQLQLESVKTKDLSEQQSQNMELQKQVYKYQGQVKEGERQIEEIKKQHQKEINEVNQQLEEMTTENGNLLNTLNSLQEQRQKHQQTLESNRNLIQMLKTELQKSIDKQSKKDFESKEQIIQETEKLFAKQIETLKREQDRLLNEKDLELQKSKEQIQTLQLDNNQYKDLIEEANQLIEEFNSEKTQLKQKVQQLLSIIQTDENQEECDLEDMIDKLEAFIVAFKVQQEANNALLVKDKSLLMNELQTHKSENLQLTNKLQQLEKDLQSIMEQYDKNDMDIREQLEIAKRKVVNYKDKLTEKQKELNSIKEELKDLQQIKKDNDNRQKQESDNSQLLTENVQLLQKLQKAENELQNYRLSQQRKNISQDNSLNNKSLRLDNNRLNYIEDSLKDLRSQLFSTKDQVLNKLSQAFQDKFETLKQNQVDHFLNRINQGQRESNQSMKLIKIIPQQDNQKLYIIQNILDEKYFILQDKEISDDTRSYLLGYEPSVEDKQAEQSIYELMNEKERQILGRLEEQIKEIREERQELQQELSIYKNKMQSGQGFEELRDLKTIELEDDVGHLNVENQELRLKIKDLSQQNCQQKSRIIELNNLILELTKGSGNNNEYVLNTKLMKAMEEIEQLKIQFDSRQGSQARPIMNEDDFDEGSFFQGIQIAGNVNANSHHEDNGMNDQNNLFDQSSLYGVIQNIPDKKNSQNNQDIQTLKRQMQELELKNQKLEKDIQMANDHPEQDQTLISHIKGTLTQFLKKCPVTDKNNEMLLEIVMSMMGFTKEESLDLIDSRKKQGPNTQRSNQNLNYSGSGTVETEEDVKKQGKKGIFNNIFNKKNAKENSLVRKTNVDVSPIRPIQRN